jgi:SAM-dependent methyltransferase
MALVPPPGFDLASMRKQVLETYERVATDPQASFPFHRGADYAVKRLGYERAALAALPTAATASFSGVGNPHRLGPLPGSAVLLDIGCGSGTDLLLAARGLSDGGRAIGVDMSRAMRSLARRNAEAHAPAAQIDVRPGFAEELPLGKQSVDVVMTNGVLNLVSDKVRVVSEIRRVLRPGGCLHLTDVVLGIDLHERERMDPHLWAA